MVLAPLHQTQRNPQHWFFQRIHPNSLAHKVSQGIPYGDTSEENEFLFVVSIVNVNFLNFNE